LRQVSMSGRVAFLRVGIVARAETTTNACADGRERCNSGSIRLVSPNAVYANAHAVLPASRLIGVRTPNRCCAIRFSGVSDATPEGEQSHLKVRTHAFFRREKG